MGKCSEPTNVRAGGQACPIRYQCAGCPHFESDPSYLPELRGYADDLRRQQEAMLAAGAADWATEGVSRQLDVIAGHVRAHDQLLAALPADCLLYTSDAADEEDSVDIGGRRIIKKQSDPGGFQRPAVRQRVGQQRLEHRNGG